MEPIIKNKKLYKELRKKHVQILDPEHTYISAEAKIGPTVIIYPNVKIIGEAKIDSFSVIEEYSVIKESEIGKAAKIGSNCRIRNSIIEGLCEIGDNCEIGPWAHLRPKSILGQNVSIGNFVEIKNSTINNNTKINHHAYIGNAEIGKNVNIGAGTITCNYDGKKKNKTIIDDNAFIGTNNSLVAPVKIGKNAYTAAGSVITKDVPDYALAIGRTKQINKEQWVKLKKDSDN